MAARALSTFVKGPCAADMIHGSSWSAWANIIAPRADHHRTPPGLAAVLVRPALRRRQNEGPGLDRPGAQQHLPVRAVPVGRVKAAGVVSTYAPAQASARCRAGKRRIIADRQSQASPRRPRATTAASPG